MKGSRMTYSFKSKTKVFCKPYNCVEAVGITNTDTSQLQPLNMERKDNCTLSKEKTQLYASKLSSPRYCKGLIPLKPVMLHNTHQLTAGDLVIREDMHQR